MITLSNLTASPDAAAKEISGPRGVTSAVHFELSPGAFVHVLLSAEGLIVRHGDIGVALPLHEIITLAVLHEPRLVALPPEPIKPEIVGAK